MRGTDKVLRNVGPLPSSHAVKASALRPGSLLWGTSTLAHPLIPESLTLPYLMPVWVYQLLRGVLGLSESLALLWLKEMPFSYFFRSSDSLHTHKMHPAQDTPAGALTCSERQMQELMGTCCCSHFPPTESFPLPWRQRLLCVLHSAAIKAEGGYRIF